MIRINIKVPEWMLKFLNIREGSRVTVNIEDGKFNMKSAEWKPGDPEPQLPQS